MTKTKTKKSDDPQEQSAARSAPQVNDISKPGQTAALPTSRPIITSHTGIIKQDPMVAAEDSSSAEQTSKPDENPEAVSNKSETVINPIVSEQDTKDSEAEPEKEEKIVETPEDNTEAKESDTPDEEENTQDSSSSDSAAIDSLADSAEAKKQASKDAETKEKEAEKVKELIANKKYFVPIVEGGHKATSQRFMTWLLILLILASVGVYFAIDAGYLDVGLELPYDLIKE